MQASLAENLEERVGSEGQKDRLKRAQGPDNSVSNETTSRGFYIRSPNFEMSTSQ